MTEQEMQNRVDDVALRYTWYEDAAAELGMTGPRDMTVEEMKQEDRLLRAKGLKVDDLDHYRLTDPNRPGHEHYWAGV